LDGGTSLSSCEAPPACSPPGGTDTYSFQNGTVACVCAPGYAGVPFALTV
jgi:hypothetical protein